MEKIVKSVDFQGIGDTTREGMMFSCKNIELATACLTLLPQEQNEKKVQNIIYSRQAQQSVYHKLDGLQVPTFVSTSRPQ